MADERGHGEQLAGDAVEAGQPPGHAQLHRAGQRAGVDTRQGRVDVAEQFGEEERVALGPGPHRVERGRRRKEGGHLVTGDAGKHQVTDAAVGEQLGEQGREGVGAIDRRVAVGGDHEHRAVAGAGQHVLEHADRRTVGAVEIVEDQQDGSDVREVAQEAGGVPEQLLSVLRERRLPREPGPDLGDDVGEERTALEHVDRCRPGCLGEGVDHGRIGHGPSRWGRTGQHPPARRPDLGRQLAGEGGLADAGIARDEDDLAVAGDRQAPGLAQFLKLRIAADEGWQLAPLFGGIRGGSADTSAHPGCCRSLGGRPLGKVRDYLMKA